jgi:hypothetical protein
MANYSNTTKVWLEKQNHPIVHENSKSYQKGDLFCVYEEENKRTFKYPIIHVWRIEESYPDNQRAHPPVKDGK